jgi:cytochrome b
MRVPLWDLPVRAFHWALAALVLFSYVTGQLAGSWLAWHMRSGYAILALVAFRLAWGLVGSETARFTHFLRGPRAAADYVRSIAQHRHARALGHNPLGGWMVVVMLGLLATQAVSGLFVDDEIATHGPLTGTVSNAVVAKMTALHHYNQWAVAAAVVLHVLAIVVYHRAFRMNLVGPMLHGAVDWPRDVPPPRQASVARALVVAAMAACAVYWLVVVFPRAG